MGMDFRFASRNFSPNVDPNWRNPNMPMQSAMFSDSTVTRNFYLSFPFTRTNNNLRNRSNYNRRSTMRCFPRILEMRNFIRRTTQQVHDACDEFDDVTSNYQEAKMRIEASRNELVNVKLRIRNSVCQLERLFRSFQSPRIMNSLNALGRHYFPRELENIQRDIEEAKDRLRVAVAESGERATLDVTESGERNVSWTGIRGNDTESSEFGRNGEIDRCSVCMENSVNAVLYTCGHMCMCFSCSRELQRRLGDDRRCPICRAVILDVIKIYKS